MNISNSPTINTTEKNNNSVIGKHKLSYWQGIKVASHTVIGTFLGGIGGFSFGIVIDQIVSGGKNKNSLTSPIFIAITLYCGFGFGLIISILSYRKEIAKQHSQELPIENEKIRLQNMDQSIDIV